MAPTGPAFSRGGHERIWEAFGRVDADAEPPPRDVLTDLYGTGPHGGLNTKAAAADLGVSERTVRRWAKQGIPAHQAGEQLRAQHQDWQASPDGREAKMGSRRESRLRNNGTTLTFTGVIKISGDVRRRTTTIPINGGHAGAIIDAILAGNDTAALDALEDAFGDRMGGSVSLAIESLSTKG